MQVRSISESEACMDIVTKSLPPCKSWIYTVLGVEPCPSHLGFLFCMSLSFTKLGLDKWAFQVGLGCKNVCRFSCENARKGWSSLN